MKSYRVGCFALLVSLWPCLLMAQGIPITGRVADSLGGAVNGALVTLGAADRPTATTRTGADGTFSFEGVNPGAVSVQVEAPGFERWMQIVTMSAAVDPLNIVLQIAGVVESVGVVAPKLEEELPQLIERAGAREQMITAAQIQNGGYDDVAQALQALVPGLFLTPKAGPFDYVTASLQGSRTNEILWLVDGVRISNRLYNGTTPLDTIPAHMVERIEVIEGGQGLFYGTQAVAGVVNVVTKAFSDVGKAEIQGGGDTNKGGFVSGLTRGTVNGNRYVLYASTDDAAGYQPFASTDYQPSTSARRRGYDVHTAGGKYAYDFSQQLRFSASYQFTNAKLDFLQPARTSRGQVGGVADQFNERDENIFSTKVDFTPRDSVQFFFKGYAHRWDSHYTSTRNVIGQPGAIDVINDHEFWGYKDYGANVLARLTPTRDLEYFAGYDFQNYSGRDAVLLIAPNTERVHALFGQIRTTRELLPNATITAGVRYNAPTAGEKRTIWNVSGRYDLTGALFVRATVGTSFRYPDAYELFAIDPTCCFGNPNLKPEASTNVNASVGGRIQTARTVVDLEVVGFYRKVTDLIVDVDDGTGSGNTVAANTTDAVRVHGFAVLGSASLTSAVSASLGYTYTTSEQGNQLAGGYSSLPGLPSNRVNSSIDVHPARGPLGATATLNWVGRIFDNASGFGSVPSGRYAVVDLAGRYFLDQRRRQRVTARMENVFDTRYPTTHSRAFTDLGAFPYLVSTLGPPLTLHVFYTLAY
jgi:vitamin B12 transporter